MILDTENLFSDSQLLTVTTPSTNLIDMGDDDAKIQSFVERESDIIAQVDVALTGGTSLKVQVQVDDDVAFGSPTLLFESAAVPAAQLIAGFQFRIGKVPPHTSEQHMRLNYVIVGAFGAGSIVAGFVLDRQTNGVD